MHDLVIRGATVIDGTGRTAFAADVAIDGGTITDVGSDVGRAKDIVAADGLHLTPGWVDIHTHYDAQILWDQDLAPSNFHGVTTAIMGNCGLGLAPAPTSDAGRERLASLLEGVEEISAQVVERIVDWSWETFPHYLDRLAELSLAMDVGTYIPHGPLRVFAMGERGSDPDEVPTDDELEQMSRSIRGALEAGAFGFSTSRSQSHKTSDGLPAPGIHANKFELAAIAGGFRAAGGGIIEAIVDFTPVDEDFGVLRRLAESAGVAITFPLVQRPATPEKFRQVLELIRAARRDGVAMYGQVAPRPIGVLVGLGTGRNPFQCSPTFRALEALPIDERLVRLRDAQVKAAVLRELGDDAEQSLGRANELGDPPIYTAPAEARLSARAGQLDTTAASLAYDLVLQDDGENLLFLPGVNCAPDGAEAMRTMLGDDNTVIGLSDGGAHYSRTCDASFPTYLLTQWAAGEADASGFPLEELVRWQTHDTAALIGLHDRGTVEVGKRADLLLIDLPRLQLHAPRRVHDVPGGGSRMMQPVDGYEKVFVSGTCTHTHGSRTEHRPGRLVRRSSSSKSAR